MTKTFLKLDTVSLSYELYAQERMSLKKELVSSVIGGKFEKQKSNRIIIKALDQFSINLEPGDKVAVLGNNGAGKTTLLRTMAGIFKPQLGKVIISGELGVIIDPSAGIDFDSTGRENCFLMGFARGIKKADVSEVLNEIIIFSGLEDYIDMPVRTYSLGMISRLSFAFATSFKPSILLVDEGIGAGDAQFQEAAKKKLNELYNSVEILVLATHSIDLAKQYCNKYVILKNGSVSESGNLQGEK